jgi:hypothetical protein
MVGCISGGPYIVEEENEEFESLQDLVEDKKHQLKIPCPGSRFRSLFGNTFQESGYKTLKNESPKKPNTTDSTNNNTTTSSSNIADHNSSEKKSFSQ